MISFIELSILLCEVFNECDLIKVLIASLWCWFCHPHFANELSKVQRVGSELLWVSQAIKVEPEHGLV